MADTPAVRLTGLVKRFGSVTAVDDMTLTVPRGYIFGVVGPDGAGKTTLLRILCGVLLPTAGRVEVAGVDVVADPDQVKRRTGYMAQQFSQYPDLTIWENLELTADLYEVPRRQWQERAHELLQVSRLAEFKSRLAEHLSGGMKQKLALACALLPFPEVLFLDEPTTGVDPVSRREFWTLLYRLPGQGVTVVVTTPYMDEAERCMEVAFVRAGRLLDCASPERLKAKLGGRVLSIGATPLRRARDVLRTVPEVRHVALFGNRLHAAVADTGCSPAFLREKLRRAGLEVAAVEPVEPSLEDVFLGLMTPGPAEGEADE